MHKAGIACSNHRGGYHRRCPGADAVDFSWFASINGLVSGSGIVGRDVRVAEVGLAELIIGNHGNGTEAPLPSRNDGAYMYSGSVMRIGLEVSVNVGCGSLSFCSVAPDASSRVHVTRSVRKVGGRMAPECSERAASCMRKGEGNETVLVRDLALLLSVTNAIVLKGVLPRDGTHALSPCGRHPS